MADWWDQWHAGARISTTATTFNPGTGSSGGSGSTSMSTGVALALSTKASLGHTHVIGDVSSLASTLAGLATAISSKADAAHTHAIADVTNLASTLAGLAAQISTKAAGTHTHAQADVSSLVTELAATEKTANKGIAGGYAALTASSGLNIGGPSTLGTVQTGASTHASLVVTGGSTLGTLQAGASTFTTVSAGNSTLGNVNAGASTFTALSAGNSTLGSVTAGASTFVKLSIASSGGLLISTGIPAVTANTLYNNNGTLTFNGSALASAAGGFLPSTWATASTHTLTGSTTMQSAAGLSFSVSSASIYRFDFALGWQTTSTTTGIAFGVNGPASPTLLAYEWWASSGMGVLNGRMNRGFNVQTLPTAGSSAANVDEYGSLRGVVRTGANAGTLTLQFASEVAGSTVSIRAGSIGFLYGPL